MNFLSIVLGLAAQLTLNDDESANSGLVQTDDLKAEVWAHRLILGTNGGLDSMGTSTDELGLEGVLIEQLKHSGDTLTSGYCPADMWAPDAQASPTLMRAIAPRSSFSVKASAIDVDGDVDLYIAITTANREVLESGMGDLTRVRSGRSLIAMGQDTKPASVAAGASFEITLTAREACRLSRLFCSTVGKGDAGNEGFLVITEIDRSGGDPVRGEVSGSLFAANAIGVPWMMEELEEGHSITIRGVNRGKSAVTPCFAYGCI